MIIKIGLFFLLPFFSFVLATYLSEYTGLNVFVVIGLLSPVGLILFFANKKKILSYLNSDALNRSRKKNGIETVDYFRFTPFSPLSKKWELSYKDGKFDGLCIQWYKNGKKELEGNWKDGKQDGKVTQWYENSQKWEEGNYKDDKRDGKWTHWYENGQIMQEINYKDGQEDGKVTVWHENGQKVGEGNAKDGRQDGKQTLWHENDQIEATFKDGECISGDCGAFKNL